MQDDSTNRKKQTEKTAATPSRISFGSLLKWGGIILLICSPLLIFAGFVAPLQFLFYLVVGWIWFLYNSLTHISPDYSTVLIGIAALILSTFILDRLMRTLLIRTGNDSRMSWSLRSSLLATLLICVSFVTGTATIGMTHQATWLATSKEPILINSFDPVVHRIRSTNNLEQIGLALFNFHEKHRSFPAGQINNKQAKAMHSWLTSLLPFLEQKALYEQIDLNVPWNNKANRKVFMQQLSVFNNPAIREQERLIDSTTGLPVAHYAGNIRVLQRNYGMKTGEINDGATCTILAGEVNSQFQPWGKPNHLRDPALGINKHLFGFGSPFHHASSKDGAVFLMVDGSTRFLNEEIDPKILKALSTPNGCDEILNEEY